MPARKDDAILKAAVGEAREAAASIAESGTVGDHLGMEMVDERLTTHYFACTATAYPGWRWAITVARVPRGKVATVCETNLVPGEGALLSPSGCLRRAAGSGDLGPGDVLPYKEEDPYLEPGFEATGDEDVDEMATWSSASAVRGCCPPRDGRPRPSAGTTARAALTPRWRRRLRRPAPPAASSTRWQVPSALFSACAPTPGHPATVAS